MAAATLGGLGLVAALLVSLASPVAGAVAVSTVFVAGAALFIFALLQRGSFGGPYRILDEERIWDIVDVGTSIVTRKLHVRFNYRAVVVTEPAWGGGDQFVDYHAEHGELVGRVRDGSREFVVVLLKTIRQRGETARLLSRKRVENPHARADRGWIEHEIANPSHRTTVIIRFPAHKRPRSVEFRRRDGGRTHTADDSHMSVEGDRAVFRFFTKAPKTGDVYVFTWAW
jgi:hypothetical protein